MSAETNKSSTKAVKRLGTSSIAIGVFSILACELPIVLALVGLGGLSSAASVFTMPPLIEVTGITIGVFGLLLVIALLIYRVVSRVQS
ncbi:MAG: hypothetical protein ACI9WC_001106 [Arenicella sp.]|jgi:hypothetical protein